MPDEEVNELHTSEAGYLRTDLKALIKMLA